MSQIPKFEIVPYLNLLLRRKWWIIVPFLLAILGGFAYISVCSKLFKASTLILLEPQSIPESFVRSTVTETMEGRLRTISQQINSRTNLEKIIDEFHLDRQSSGEGVVKLFEYIKESFGSLGKDNSSAQGKNSSEQILRLKLVDEMRKHLHVTMRGGGSPGVGEQNMAFEISFAWWNQDVVAPVVNTIASRFIDENINAREEMATSTTDFLDKETATIRGELEAREKELEAFKKEHIGMLPDQLASNISILNQLREQLGSLERNMTQEKQQAMFVQTQEELARAERNAAASAERPEQTATTGGRGQTMTSEQFTSGSLSDLEAEFQRLSSIYTEKHPDIIALKRRIEALKREGRSAETTHVGARSNASGNKTDLRLKTINFNIDTYAKQIEETQRAIQLYKKRVEQTPQVEMELNKILRGYETVRQRYDNLLSRKLDAKMAEQMEKRKKGEQFRILDPAVKPPKPYKPVPIKVMLLALAGGLGLGCGLAYLREGLDPAFYSPEEIETYLGAEVILCLPVAEKEGPAQA
jgi:polysaccharide chain length determinant protein (PEP-CTERM system associated)